MVKTLVQGQQEQSRTWTYISVSQLMFTPLLTSQEAKAIVIANTE